MEKNQKKLVNKFIPIIQARMGSSRLPGKSLMKIGEYKLIDWVINYAKKNFFNEKIYVATTKSKDDDTLVEYLTNKDIKIFRGNELNVFSRFENISRNFNPDDIIVRFTGDNPIKNNLIIQLMKSEVIKNNIDYCCLKNLSKLSVEFIKIKLIDQIQSTDYFNDDDKEHVTWNIRNKLDCNKLIIDQSKHKMIPKLDKLITIDTLDDLLFLEKLLKKINIIPGEDLNLILLYNAIKSLKN